MTHRIGYALMELGFRLHLAPLYELGARLANKGAGL